MRVGKTKNKIRIAVIGYGYWGPNLVRNFTGLDDCEVDVVCEIRRDLHRSIAAKHPHLKIQSDPGVVFKDASIDAVVIATPPQTHEELARRAINAGKHVLIEKPMTMSAGSARRLIDQAARKKTVLMVDHTFLYTGAVRKMKEIIASGEAGKIRYVDSTRVNLGLFQSEVNVLWDLAAHDISIFDHLIGRSPVSVQARGVSHTPNGVENIAYLILNFEDDLIAHFHCSWTSPVKIRQMLFGGDKKMIVYNDMEPTEKVKVYDSGYRVKTEEGKKKIFVDYRIGDIHVPKLSSREALTGMAEDFLGAILRRQKIISDASLGLRVVSILEAAARSLKTRGREIKVPRF